MQIYADYVRLPCHEYHRRGNAARNDAGDFHVGLQSSPCIHEHHDHDNSLLSSLLSVLLVKQLLSSVP